MYGTSPVSLTPGTIAEGIIATLRQEQKDGKTNWGFSDIPFGGNTTTK